MNEINFSLLISGIRVDFEELFSFDVPRVRASIAQVEIIATGEGVGNGTFYEPRHVWEGQFVCDDTQKRNLKLVYAEHDHLRRLNDPALPCDVLIYDLFDTHEERAPRTRAIVPGTEDKIVSIGTQVSYYSCFYGWFTQEPRFTHKRGLWSASFRIQETKIVPPPV